MAWYLDQPNPWLNATCTCRWFRRRKFCSHHGIVRMRKGDPACDVLPPKPGCHGKFARALRRRWNLVCKGSKPLRGAKAKSDGDPRKRRATVSDSASGKRGRTMTTGVVGSSGDGIDIESDGEGEGKSIKSLGEACAALRRHLSNLSPGPRASMKQGGSDEAPSRRYGGSLGDLAALICRLFVP